ncbi:MAG: acyltransferase family protein [Candidatus Peregrinibacteria bacterium]
MSDISSPAVPASHPHNSTISYIKGVAILMIMLIHLLDWSTLKIGVDFPLWLREFLYPGVFFFLFLSGAVVYIAYNSRPLLVATQRLFRRGVEIFAIYYIYSIVKFWLFSTGKYPIDVEPIYYQFKSAGTWNWEGVLGLHAYAVPIGILLTIAMCLFVSPLFLWITQKVKFPKLVLSGILAVLMYIGFYTHPESSFLVDFLWSQNFIFFPPVLWLIPFLIGYLMASFGLEEKKEVWLFFFSVGVVWMSYYLFLHGKAIHPTWYMFPLQPYYVLMSLFVLSVLLFIFDFVSQLSFWGKPYLLGLLRFWGDHTLSLYLVHWVVIDATLYFAFPYGYASYPIIFTTVPLMIVIFTLVRWKKAKKAIQAEMETGIVS